MKYSRRSRDLKRYSFITVTLLALTPLVPHAQRSDTTPRASVQPAEQVGQSRLLAKYGKLPLGFEANHGQTNPQVKFVARGSGYVVFLTASEAVLVSKSATDASQASHPGTSILRMKLVGGNANPKVSGADELPGKSNYYIGKDPSQWRTNVPQYAQVRYEDVYPDIDLVYYGNQEGRLEHDFIVAPGADPSVVAFAFQDDDTPVMAPDGDLILHKATSQQAPNEIRLQRPVIYQEVNGVRREISGSYDIRKDRLVGFRIGPYDRGQPLIIDPVLAIDYSTFLGGSNIDGSNSLAVDASGNTHVAGQTLSLDFPVASAFQPVYAGGDSDHFVAKLTPDGAALVYSTYLGGSLTEGVNQGAIALDAFGNAYVAGSTQSADFPTTLLAFQPALANPGQGFLSFDGYVVKLNASGALVYSTLLGGSSFDGIYAIDVDTAGNAYVTGNTISNDFPTFLPIEPNQRNNFITKLDATGSALVYSTYFAGDIGTGIAVDILGNAIVTGLTQSTNFPVVNAVQPTMDPTECFPNVRCGDAFVSKVNPFGTGFVYSTFLGGNNIDRGNDIDVDASGAVYVIGDTRSTNFPTFNALQPTFGGVEDAFVVKLTATGSFVYSTYLGGSETEGGGFGNAHIVTLGIIIDGAGNAYLSGTTRSADFPAVDAMQPFVTGAGTESQAFIAKLNASGSALEYSTPVNPPLEISQAVEIGIDSQGNAYIAGGAGFQFPTTAGSFQPFNAGSSDAYILKLTTTGGVPATLTLNPPAATNVIDTQHCVTATVRDTGGDPTADITVRFTVTGAVNTSGTGATNADGEATFCYQGPSLPGADAITAFADNDNDGVQDVSEPTGAATKAWVLPTTTPLCEIKITNGGRITAANGDTATFGGNAKASILGQTSGQEQYQDHGPVQPLNVHSINVQAIACEGETQASIYGQATIDGAGLFIYRIRVQDLGEPGAGHDTYGILLSNGYNSGEQVLEGGNVQIHRE